MDVWFKINFLKFKWLGEIDCLERAGKEEKAHRFRSFLVDFYMLLPPSFRTFVLLSDRETTMTIERSNNTQIFRRSKEVTSPGISFRSFCQMSFEHMFVDESVLLDLFLIVLY